MITINLLPEEMRKQGGGGFGLPQFIPGKTLLLALGGFLALQALFTVFSIWRYFEAKHFTSAVSALKVELKEVLARKEEAAIYDQKAAMAESLMRRKFYWTQILNSLSQDATKGIWLRDLSVQEGQESQIVKKKESGKKGASADKVRYIKLEGSALAPGQEMAYIGKFLKALKDDAKLGELFNEIQLSNINQKRMKDLDVADFTIVLVFRREKL